MMKHWPPRSGDESRAREFASEAFHDDPRNPSSCQMYESSNRHRCPCESKWQEHLEKARQ